MNSLRAAQSLLKSNEKSDELKALQMLQELEVNIVISNIVTIGPTTYIFRSKPTTTNIKQIFILPLEPLSFVVVTTFPYYSTFIRYHYHHHY